MGLNIHAICLLDERLNNPLLEIIAGNIESLSIFPFLELLDLATGKSLYISCDVFSSNLDRRYSLIFERFGNVHFPSTGDKHLDAAWSWRSYYTSNKAKDVLSLLLRTLIQSIKHNMYLGQIFDK